MAASVKNPWIGYLDRSYEQIKASLLGRVTTSNPELTDHSSSNIFVILIEMFAAIAEMLGYYIDNVAIEAYLATAIRRSSVITNSRTLDYRVRARSPEQVDLTITFNIPSPSAFTLSAGMTIESDEGIIYTLISDQAVPINATSIVVPIAEFTEIDQPIYAVTNGSRNQKISLGTTYVHGTSGVLISALEYEEQQTFGYSGKLDRHYIVEVESDGNAYLVMGDGLRGIIPPNAQNVNVKFRTTLGPDGKVGAGRFDDNTIVLNSALPGGLTITSANTLLASSGGAFYEDIESIRSNAINGIRTMDRMVNRKDHEDIMEAVSGVAKAKVHFCCGKTIDLYIVPQGGGVASGGLIAAAQAVAEEKKMVATFPRVLSSGETRLVLKATVTARKRKSVIETKEQVEDVLVEFGLIENQEINGAIRLSDIQALIDNQPNVDFVDLTAMYTKPFARPITPTTNTLDWDNQTFAQSVNEVDYKIEYDGANMRLVANNIFIANVPIGVPYITPDGSFSVTLNAAIYTPGDSWEFTVYPFLKNIQLSDYTIFRILLDDLSITVNSAPSTNTDAC